MSFSLVMGTLGSGKTSYAVDQALRYLTKGRRVASNFPLDFTSFRSVKPDAYVTVLPDIPASEHLYDLGRGGKSEHDAGLFIIDEGAFCLNARNWQDKERQKIIEWFALSRKLAWDVIVIIQHIQALDKQVRLLFGEHVVFCRRLDKLKIAGIIPLPKVHLAIKRYGTLPTDPIADRTFYRPASIGKAYDTQKLFGAGEQCGPYCTLTRHLAVTRYLPKKKPVWSQLLLLPIQVCMALALIVWARSFDMSVINAKLESAS